ncbi:MAG: thioredoxin family protein [Bacteroidetes bacterium]|nr:thioredoxin family protein [Bacteroidota bacterium]
MNAVRNLAVVIILLLSGCAAETFTIETEATGTKIIRGSFHRSVLEEGEDFSWFRTHYDAYRPDSAAVAAMRPLVKDLRVIIIAGTWCGDSKREVPKQFRILDALGVPDERITMVGVDRSKRSADSTTMLLRIFKVPTTIFFRGEQELGRIVEFPHETHEKDMLKLLSF